MPSITGSANWVVLAVVDDPAVRASLKFALEVEGYRVAAFASGEELLAEDPLPRQACLILDHVVPRVDGIAIASTLRGRGVDFPAILMTADAHDALRRRASAARLTVLEKPLVGNALAEAIRVALAER